MKIKMALICFTLMIAAIVSFSQEIDPSFVPPIPIKGATIHAMKILPDGRMMLAGSIQFHTKTKVNNVIRLNSDGTLDNSFSSTLPDYFRANDMDTQSTGDVIVLSTHSTRSEIIRLSNTGETKKRIVLHRYFINSIKVTTDDKLLVCGTSSVGGIVKKYNADLTEDLEFSGNANFNATVFNVALQQNKIIATGIFYKVNGINCQNIARLNSDGSFDPSFAMDENTNIGYETPITIQDDNKILLGNGSTLISSKQVYYPVLRLEEDGAFDYTFNSPSIGGIKSNIKLKGDKILVLSSVYSNPITSTYNFTQLSKYGVVEKSFSITDLYKFTELTSDDPAVLFDINSTNDVIFSNGLLHPVNEYGILKFSDAGLAKTDFKPEISTYGKITILDSLNDQLIVGGDFIKINDVRTFNIARINSDGSVDPNMTMLSPCRPVNVLKALDEETIYVGADYTFFKINSTGEVQTAFNYAPSSWYESTFLKIAIQKDGKIIGVGQNIMTRLNTDGSRDPSFTINKSVTTSPHQGLVIQKSGRIIFGAQFKSFNGAVASNIIGLHPDGSIDETFNVGSGTDDMVAGVHLLKNDSVLITGYFKKYNTISIPSYIMKLAADGELDAEFNQNIEYQNFIPSMLRSFKDNIFRVEVGYDSSGAWYDVVRKNMNGTSDWEFRIPEEVYRIPYLYDLGFTDNAMFLLGKTFLVDKKEPIFMLKVIPMPITDIQENVSSGITSYPNPVASRVFITINNASILYQKGSIRIIDINGKLIQSESMTIQKEISTDVENMQPGFYMVSVETNGFRSKPIKIIKQ